MSAAGRPDFLIIGAMKSGTTTLQTQLAAQDGVFMTTPKEPNFFSDDDVYARGAGWYHSLFDAAAPGDLKGEASTHYTKLPTYPQTVPRMAAMLEAPRLIYVIRDPVARAVSHYIHEWSEGRMDRDPVAAFATHAELVEYGRYPRQLAPFIAEFGLPSIYLTSLEQLKTDPEGELRRIGDHLGAGPFVWDHGIGAQNVSAERVRRLPLQGLLVDNPLATMLRRTLVPKSVRTRIRLARTHGDRPALPADLRHRLERTFTPDRTALAELFPDHPALDACYGFATA
ncbi:sulfotransferase domain-containing protein [Roseobacter sp. YSTF-M11]|uniref:Sulfotransferase domain-containing protein n=1 Tax=Roseobacter insulae TaxID=2859783 RepID=A0A9X1K0Z6_9RHOB|nr:sulfotransferase [Roseobacter insulae]MBW4710790.1 sulfotransferase domain-containing protein [Roseobacter insulae]